MPVLHLGVIDLPYQNAPKKGQKKSTASTVTTGQVAGWLEDKYHIMEIFGREHEQDIANDLASAMGGALENLMMGAPPSSSPLAGAESRITERMKSFLSMNELARLGYPGVPTKAAQDRAQGRRASGRMKHARKSNAPPVSFIDTGLYQSSMISWVD